MLTRAADAPAGLLIHRDASLQWTLPVACVKFSVFKPGVYRAAALWEGTPLTTLPTGFRAKLKLKRAGD